MPQGEAFKSLNTLALSNFSIPGDPAFPLNVMYQAPADRFQTGKNKDDKQNRDKLRC